MSKRKCNFNEIRCTKFQSPDLKYVYNYMRNQLEKSEAEPFDRMFRTLQVKLMKTAEEVDALIAIAFEALRPHYDF